MKRIEIRLKDETLVYWMDWYEWEMESLFYRFNADTKHPEYIKQLEILKNKQMEELLKERLDLLRTELDGVAKLIKTSQEAHYTPAMARIHASSTKVEMAKAWMGIIKKHLGSASPYINDGKRHEVSDITPTANVSTILEQLKEGVVTIIGRKLQIDWSISNQIEKLDFLREELEVILTDFAAIQAIIPNREAAIARTEAWKYMVEAKMELGFALAHIKEQAELVASIKTTNDNQVSPN